MKRHRLYLLLALLALFAGCASAPPQPSVAPEVPDEPLSVPESTAPPEPAPIRSNNAAVIALLDRVQLDSAAGKHGTAGASLERALRIEPRNPWLWHELAQLRLTQGLYAQSITLARKSNSFAGRDRRLQARNWRLIGDARVALGDTAGAEQAFRLAANIEQAAQP